MAILREFILSFFPMKIRPYEWDSVLPLFDSFILFGEQATVRSTGKSLNFKEMENNQGVQIYVIIFLISLISLGLSALSDFLEKKKAAGILRTLLLIVLVTTVTNYIFYENESFQVRWGAGIATFLMLVSNLAFALELRKSDETSGKIMGGFSLIGIIIYILLSVLYLT